MADAAAAEPDDYVLATGETHSVREFVEMAFAGIGVAVEWRGKGVDEQGVDVANGRILVDDRSRYFRPTEVDLLQGDPSKALEKLGWRHQTKIYDLVAEMVRGRPAGHGARRAAFACINGTAQCVIIFRSLASASGSPATAEWSVRRGAAACARKMRSLHGRSHAPSSTLRDQAEVDAWMADTGLTRSSSRRPRSAGFSPTTREPAEFIYENMMIAGERDRRRASRRRRSAAVPRLVLHLSASGAAADPRGRAADWPVGADQ